MIIIKEPTHIGVYKLNKKAKIRVIANMIRQQRTLREAAGKKINKIVIVPTRQGQSVVKPAPPQRALFPTMPTALP